MSSAERAVNIADLRLMAQRRLPKMVFDYIDGGADGEVTLSIAGTAFAGVPFDGAMKPGSCVRIMTGAIMPPIYATSTYVQASPGVHQGLAQGLFAFAGQISKTLSEPLILRINPNELARLRIAQGPYSAVGQLGFNRVMDANHHHIVALGKTHQILLPRGVADAV